MVLLLAHSKEHAGIPAKEVAPMVTSLWGVEVNSRWSQRFLAKHNECLRARKTKLLGKTRTWEATREDVDHWLASLRAARVMSHMSAHTVLNYDETCAHADLEGHVCVEAVDKLRANRSGVRNRAICSMVPFVVGGGTVLLVVYILPTRFDPDGSGVVDTPNPASRYPSRASPSVPRPTSACTRTQIPDT